MKKIICSVLSVMLIISSLGLNAYAVESAEKIPFDCEVYAEKQSYEKGEEINIYAYLKNNTLDEITDMRIWMDYPLTEYYLTPGITERFENSVEDYVNMKFRVVEDEGVLNFASKFDGTTLIKGFLLRLAHTYKLLTLAYTTLRYDFTNFFVSFGQKNADLGTVTVMYDDTEIEFSLKCRYSVKKSDKNEITDLSNESGSISADIKAVENSYTGLVFASDENNENYGLFAVNSDYSKIFLFEVENGKFNRLASKTVDVKSDNFYKMKVIYENGKVLCYFLNNEYDTQPYPVFDMYYESENSGYGVCCKNDGYKNFTVGAEKIKTYDETYTNPVYDNSPDPYILKDGETYYLYATTAPGNGYLVSSSTDLVNWVNLGYCAEKGDIYGDGDFWAPEVYKYQGKYYLLYSTDEHLALAVANSPTGPFMKTKDGYLLEDKCIDGHLLFDDDGSVYMYMAYWGETGEEIWGCKMKSNLSGIVTDTLTRLTYCKDDEGGVNEGPAMLKYEGKYYLTYSVNGYESHNYKIKLAVSSFPLGDYESKGTILEKAGSSVGVGHHSFTTSPDGTELIIAYHCHNSVKQVHNRKLCIDRCKFVKTNDGYTISIYGPTTTAQPYPGNK